MAACARRALFQSTRPRRARHVGNGPTPLPVRVSIHAPTKSATNMTCANANASARFQSTRPRRARPHGQTLRDFLGGFNPRAHEERDSCGAIGVATTAPFQSTRPRRARRSRDLTNAAWVKTFQSTRPRRARRPRSRSPRRARSGFNPRAHEERDPTPAMRCAMVSAFQSTRPRRARPRLACCPAASSRRFNPRAHEERDQGR